MKLEQQDSPGEWRCGGQVQGRETAQLSAERWNLHFRTVNSKGEERGWRRGQRGGLEVRFLKALNGKLKKSCFILGRI